MTRADIGPVLALLMIALTNTAAATETVCPMSAYKWRVCFRWRDGHAFDVEIVDYH